MVAYLRKDYITMISPTADIEYVKQVVDDIVASIMREEQLKEWGYSIDNQYE